MSEGEQGDGGLPKLRPLLLLHIKSDRCRALIEAEVDAGVFLV